ncbi:response regulator [Gymnodinialimonas sp. 2305UL16-5]|uniref:response regulator n=1 Tax=Gymnodinialimonas mytili TaxID=3126503 RepID=UPI0030B711D0
MSVSSDVSGTRKPTLILVEDDEALLFLLSEQLTEMGYDLVPVSSGSVAWQLIEDGLGFDLLISDVVLPGGIGGFELTRRVQQLHPDKPALLLSGYGRHVGDAPSDVNAQVLPKTTSPDLLGDEIVALLQAAS